MPSTVRRLISSSWYLLAYCCPTSIIVDSWQYIVIVFIIPLYKRVIRTAMLINFVFLAGNVLAVTQRTCLRLVQHRKLNFVQELNLCSLGRNLFWTCVYKNIGITPVLTTQTIECVQCTSCSWYYVTSICIASLLARGFIGITLVKHSTNFAYYLPSLEYENVE